MCSRTSDGCLGFLTHLFWDSSPDSGVQDMHIDGLQDLDRHLAALALASSSVSGNKIFITIRELSLFELESIGRHV